MTILDEDKGMCGVHAPVPHLTACTIRPAKFPTNCTSSLFCSASILLVHIATQR